MVVGWLGPPVGKMVMVMGCCPHRQAAGVGTRASQTPPGGPCVVLQLEAVGIGAKELCLASQDKQDCPTPQHAAPRHHDCYSPGT